MEEYNFLRNPDVTDMSPLRLADIGTPGTDTGMPPLRLSDIMTPDAKLRGDDDNGTAPVDSGREASAPTTATAGWQIHVPDPQPIDSETAGRLKQNVCHLNDENRLLKQKLNLLQKNSNLKQVALIGTVISWFGDKGLFEDDDVNTACRLTSMMLSAREFEQVGQSVADGSNKLDVPWKQHTVSGTPVSALNATDKCLNSSSPDSNARRSMNDDTSEWLSPSLGSSFNPPFSSSKKEIRRPITLPEDGTLLTKCGPRQGDNKGNPADSACFQFPNVVKTDSFDDNAKRLDTRLRRMEDAVHGFSDRHAETRSRRTQLRQNAVKRFRVWKALAASRRLAAVNSSSDGEEPESEDLVTDTSITPTPLTQYPLDNSAKEIEGSKTVVGLGGTSNQTILGEIVFQVERRILAFVFQRKEMLYGYNVGNLDIMIRTHPDQGSRSVLQRRYDLLMDVLRSCGWLRGRHPQFVAEMIARHGTLQDVETAKTEAVKRGWRNPSELKRGVLCLCPVTEVLDMLVILDCLLHMARKDGLPVFLW